MSAHSVQDHDAGDDTGRSLASRILAAVARSTAVMSPSRRPWDQRRQWSPDRPGYVSKARLFVVQAAWAPVTVRRHVSILA